MVRPEVARVAAALAGGELSCEGLAARRVAALLGKTTGALYHHFGSLDRFLYEVAQHGWRLVAAELAPRLSEPPEELAEAWLRWVFAHPELYRLMADHPFHWARLRDAGAFDTEGPALGLFDALVARLALAGSPSPPDDARAIQAVLQGLASLALSGRANVREVDTPDEEVAVRVARHAVSRLARSS